MDASMILVTGARGYIGGLLCMALSDAGHTVYGIDDESNPNAPVTADCYEVRRASETPDLVARASAVVHLAAMSRIDVCEERPASAWLRNTAVTDVLTDYCQEKTTPIVYASTRAVEERPDSIYAGSKLAGEAHIRQLAGWYPAEIIRKPNVYGDYAVGDETVTKGTVIDVFREQARAGGPLTVHAPGTQEREFIHIRDVVNEYVDAVERVVDAPPGVTTRRLTGDRMTIHDAARWVRDEINPDASIEIVTA